MRNSRPRPPLPIAGETPLTPGPASLTTAQRWLFGLILGVGIVLRFTNLLHKPVWIDEAFTLFHLSGLTQASANQHLVTGAAIPANELLTYQGPHPTTNLIAMIRNIGDTAPELPPLYFALLYGWTQLFGDHLVSLRILSSLFSVGALPAMYWLCRELFGRPIVGWYAMALMAVSPFQLMMAQEIRPYSLWTLLLIITTAFLVRAQRSGRWGDWVGFSLGLTAGLYNHLATVIPGVAYGFACLLNVRGNILHPKFRQFFGAVSLSVVGFAPWIWFGFLRPMTRETPYTIPHTSQFGVIQGVVQSLMRFFADFNLNQESPRWALALYALVMLSIITLILKSLIYLWRQGPREVRWLLLSLAIVPIACLVNSDITANTSRTLYTRYYIPSAIAIEATIAYFIASRHATPARSRPVPNASPTRTRWQRRWLALLLIGTVSCGWFVMSPNWWHKNKTMANACIQQATAPIAGKAPATIVTDEFFMRSLGLVHQLNPAVQFKFYPIDSDQAPVGIAQPSTYLFMPSPKFAEAMGQRYDLQPVCRDWLWQVNPKR